ncbi:MAG: putative Zn finger-like uncharacterized protein [Cognaticolwellia sp.]|jgi:predicted Zn finger-like uncharacterized protein
MVSAESQRMIVTCPECAARYKLDSSRVSARGARITCPRCKHVFVVYPSQRDSGSTTLRPTGFQEESASSESTPVAAAKAPAPSPAPKKSRRRASDLDFRKVGIGSWKVRVKIGLVYDFSDIKTLRKYIADGRVTPEDVISHDGSTWVPIGDIPDLDAYFVEVYERAEAGSRATPEPSPIAPLASPLPPASAFEEDNPTRIMRVGGGLGSNLAAQTLAAAAAEAAQAESNPAPAPGARPFVDPFAQLKEEKRRRPAAKRAATPAEAPKSKALPIVAAVLVLTVVGLGAWWYLTQPQTPVVLPNQGPENTAEMDKARENAASELEKLDDELRRDLERSKAEDAEREDRDKLVPVGPRGPGPGLRPVVPDRLPQDGGDSIAVDHAGQCKAAAGRSDWSSAVSSCSQATQSNGRDMSAQVSYGIALFETGKTDGARVQFDKAKGLGSRDARIEKYLGHIARKQGDVFGANAHYQAYLATQPRDAAAIQALMQGG